MSADRTPAAAEWWLEESAPKVANAYTPDSGELALMYLSDALNDLAAATQGADTTVGDATRFVVESEGVSILADTVALIQDLRKRLGVIESYVAREAGYLVREMKGTGKGYTSDGRVYEVRRGAVRKSWDHQEWQHAVRAKVTAQVAGEDDVAVDATTGEPVFLRAVVATALALAQAVHGAGAPKVTALKALALDPEDYCESSPGPFSITISPTTTTTPGA